ncbi:hypothetical protein MTR67_048170, partial [Solanum verrucosum]
FLGLESCYKLFVEGFSSITSFLYRLTHKKVKFLWSVACEKNFYNLKNRLTLVPVLTLLEGLDDFLVYFDPSRITLCCVLMYHGNFKCYSSGQLKVHEKNYPTHDL